MVSLMLVALVPSQTAGLPLVLGTSLVFAYALAGCMLIPATPEKAETLSLLMLAELRPPSSAQLHTSLHVATRLDVLCMYRTLQHCTSPTYGIHSCTLCSCSPLQTTPHMPACVHLHCFSITQADSSCTLCVAADILCLQWRIPSDGVHSPEGGPPCGRLGAPHCAAGGASMGPAWRLVQQPPQH